MEDQSVVGVVWYKSREDFEKLKTLYDDHHKMQLTYEEWLLRAEKELERRVSEGDVIEKVYLGADMFPEWCHQRNMKMDAHARIDFVNWIVRMKHGRRN